MTRWVCSVCQLSLFEYVLDLTTMTSSSKTLGQSFRLLHASAGFYHGIYSQYDGVEDRSGYGPLPY